MDVSNRNEIVVHYGNKKGLRVGSGDLRVPGQAVPESKSWKRNVFNANMKTNRIQTRAEYDYMKMVNEQKPESEGKSEDDELKNELGETHEVTEEAEVEHGSTGEAESEKILAALEEMSVSDLRKKAKEVGVTQQGKKKDLIERISSVMIEKE